MSALDALTNSPGFDIATVDLTQILYNRQRPRIEGDWSLQRRGAQHSRRRPLSNDSQKAQFACYELNDILGKIAR